MSGRAAVILSRGRSGSPDKRAREAALAERLRQAGFDVLVVPLVYDLAADSRAAAALRERPEPLVLAAPLFPRAAFWTLRQLGVEGRAGVWPGESPDGALDRDSDQEADDAQRAIYCLDVRDAESVETLAERIERLADQLGWRRGRARPGELITVDEPSRRRWYPVIDFDRCTHCLECVDFCLFGVYGVDERERIVVEEPDACRAGCPACSRVCPEGAIAFPLHKTPGIAGGDAGPGDWKLDLSDLLAGLTPEEVADRERREHGEAGRPSGQDDALDRLLDALDQFDG